MQFFTQNTTTFEIQILYPNLSESLMHRSLMQDVCANKSLTKQTKTQLNNQSITL